MTAAANLGSGETVGGIPSIDPRWDARFRQLTSLGNAAFHDGEDIRADAHYRDALDEAEQLFAAASRGGSAILIAPMALTIAANNLAAAIDRTGMAEAARTVSIEAAERLVVTAEAVDQPIALRLNCLRHLPHALAFLAEFEAGHAEPHSKRLIERAMAVRDAVMRVARLWQDAGETWEGAGSTAPRRTLS